MLNVAAIRRDFPILDQEVNGKPLVYLDSAATSQKPLPVLAAYNEYYRHDNANVHRAIHTLGERATARYEEAREKVARFLGVRQPETVVFTRGTSESLNIVAHGWAYAHLGQGDEILCTPIEHHSNLVPWQQVARRTGARLRFIPLNSDGSLDLTRLSEVLTNRTRLVAITQASNVLGTLVDVGLIAREAHKVGAVVVVDGAQSAPHMPINLTDLDVDFFALSGHKMCAPTGIGVLYGRRDMLEQVEPVFFGGSMISHVALEESTWAELPARLEAGTPNIGGAIALGAAVDYLTAIGMDNIHQHEQALVRYAWDRLKSVDGVSVYGPEPPNHGGAVSFNLLDVHPHDVSTILDEEGVAVRAGHHCAQPLHEWLNVAATNRASFYLYNTEADVDRLVTALARVKEIFCNVA